MSLRFSLFLFILTTCIFNIAISGIVDEMIVIKNGILIDGTGSPPKSQVTIVIKNDRILRVSDDANIPQDSQIINAKGRYILPGFINAHVHNGFSPSYLERWAADGVTTVRDLGVVYHRDLAQDKQELNSSNLRARLITAGPLLTVPGGYPIAVFNAPIGYPIAHDEKAILKTVPAILESGADLLKISLERGKIFNQQIPVFSNKEAQSIVAIAKNRQTRVSAHITARQDIDLALDAGVADLAHMVVDGYLDQQTIQKVIQAGVYWIPTLELWHGVGGANLGRAIENLRRFYRAGGLIALGTDYDGYTTPFELGMPMCEMKLMQQADMSSLDIIQSATRHAAVVCNMGNDLGTIEPGKIADIIMTENNPLQDLGQLRSVPFVMHNGEIIVNLPH